MSSPTQQEILKANEAELILKSDVFKEAVQNLRAEYIYKWESANDENVDFRENLHKSIRILPEIEKHLRIIVEKGKITKTQIEKLRGVYKA